MSVTPRPRVLAPLLASALFLAAAPIRAACDGPFPSFRQAARSAQTIVVGTVTAIDPQEDDPQGYASVFELRIDYVLKGDAGARMTIDRLQPSPCSGILYVPAGAVIALALDGRAFQPPMDVNAPAFIEGLSFEASLGERAITKPDEMTLAEVFAATGVPIPDAATEAPHGDLPVLPFVVVLSAVGVSIVAFRASRPINPRP